MARAQTQTLQVSATLWREPRFFDLCKHIGAPTPTTLGLLLMTWERSRAEKFEGGSDAALLDMLPGGNVDRETLLSGLLAHGYVNRDETGMLHVEANADYFDLLKKRSRAGHIAAHRIAEKKQKRQARSAKASKAPKATPVARITDAQRDANRAAWAAYTDAFFRRWGCMPTHNARSASCVANFVRRIGQADAPAVAAFFVTHNRRDYLSGMHDVGMLLRDAESLRAQWQRGAPITSAEIAQAEKANDLRGQMARIQSGVI